MSQINVVVSGKVGGKLAMGTKSFKSAIWTWEYSILLYHLPNSQIGRGHRETYLC